MFGCDFVVMLTKLKKWPLILYRSLVSFWPLQTLAELGYMFILYVRWHGQDI